MQTNPAVERIAGGAWGAAAQKRTLSYGHVAFWAYIIQ